MLKRKLFVSPSKPNAGGQPRTLLPVWVQVVLCLLVILLVATMLTVVASNELVLSGSVAAQPMIGAGGTAIAALSESRQGGAGDLPEKVVAQPVAPGAAQRTGVLILVPTASHTPVPVTPSATTVELPDEVLLLQVPNGKQTRSLNCEFQTASDLAWYYGRPFTWEEIYRYVGHDVGGNPHKGFVGRSFDDDPGQLYPLGYGVYAEPIAAALTRLDLVAEVSYDNPVEWLKAQIASGHPVMVWATAELAIRPVATWTASDGVTVKGVPGEHTYLAIGYSSQGVWLIDPWDGQSHFYDWQAFLASWDLLDRMALVVIGEPASATMPTPIP